MPLRFRVTIPRFTIGKALRSTIKTALQFTIWVTLLLANTPKVEANQPKPNQNNSVCQEEVLPHKPPLQQNGESCQTSEPSGTEDLGESSTQTNTDAPANDTENNLNDANEEGVVDDATGLEPNNVKRDSSNIDTDNNNNRNIPDNSVEQSNPPSSQDSHNINFSLDLNLGGGSEAPLDSGTEAMPPEPDQTDTSSENPSQNAPTSSEGSDSQELASPNPKAEAKNQSKNKAQKHNQKQQNKEEERKKGDRLSPHKHIKGFSDEGSKPHLKPEKNQKLQTKEQHPKRIHENPHIKDNSHIDKLKGSKPRNHRPERLLKRAFDKPSLPHRLKSDRKGRSTLKHSPRQSHPKSRHRFSDLQRQRSQSHPSRNRLRRSVSPTKVLRSPSRRMSHPNRK